jgi:hypothetical protein
MTCCAQTARARFPGPAILICTLLLAKCRLPLPSFPMSIVSCPELAVKHEKNAAYRIVVALQAAHERILLLSQSRPAVQNYVSSHTQKVRILSNHAAAACWARQVSAYQPGRASSSV